MRMPHAKHEDPSIILDEIDHKMCLEWLEAHRRDDLPALPRHAGMVADQLHKREEFFMIASGLRFAKGEDAAFGNGDDVLFRLAGQTEPHDQRPVP